MSARSTPKGSPNSKILDRIAVKRGNNEGGRGDKRENLIEETSGVISRERTRFSALNLFGGDRSTSEDLPFPVYYNVIRIPGIV
jgi:hypothetical protein